MRKILTDEVPIKAPTKQSHAFVVGTASKDVSDNWRGMVDETHNADTRQPREDPLREDLIDTGG